MFKPAYHLKADSGRGAIASFFIFLSLPDEFTLPALDGIGFNPPLGLGGAYIEIGLECPAGLH